jgi:hypothetical protein
MTSRIGTPSHLDPFLKRTVNALQIGLTVACLCSWPEVGLAQIIPIAPPGLTVKDGHFFKGGKPYRGVGANYFDLFIRVLKNPSNISSLEGLQRLSKAGIPFVRCSMGFGAEDWKFYFENREEYLRRMDLVVRAAEQSKIGLIPSLFWTFRLSDIAGEHGDQWGNPESKTIAMMRQYVGDIVSRYRDSPAIWGWEFGNEPNLHVDLPNAAALRRPGRTERDDLKSAQMAVALAEFGKEVRRHDTTRPIFSGNSHPRASAWHNTAEKSWKPDTREQFREIVIRDNPAPLNTIGVHIYGGIDMHKEAATWASGWRDWLHIVKTSPQLSGRPVFVGEFASSANNANETEERAIFESLLSDMDKEGVDLAAFWVFDLKSQEKSGSATFDNKRAYMIQLAAEANRRWGSTAQGAP